MENYVTLFDRLFLPQGLALQRSMERHAGPYTLWILCMDDEALEALKKLNLPHVRLLQLSALETEALVQIKSGRTKREYCWTLTPFALRYVFDADPSLPRVTYLDADMWFRKNPAVIFRELEASGKHVLITDHCYAPEYDYSATSGQYCVQFMTFIRAASEPVRKWWQDRCLEWCHARFENGKYGDQKYLDDWPERFPEHVHVLADKELLLAPWNATRFPYGHSVCWHFHMLRIVISSCRRIRVDCGPYPLPLPLRQYVYQGYLKDLGAAMAQMAQHGLEITGQAKPTIREWVKAVRMGNWQRMGK
jgi:hypothetical protein